MLILESLKRFFCFIKENFVIFFFSILFFSLHNLINILVYFKYFNDRHYVLRLLKMGIKHVISTLPIINLTRGMHLENIILCSMLCFLYKTPPLNFA